MARRYKRDKIGRFAGGGGSSGGGGGAGLKKVSKSKPKKSKKPVKTERNLDLVSGKVSEVQLNKMVKGERRKAALVGGAIGTVLMPGLGTAGGAAVGYNMAANRQRLASVKSGTTYMGKKSGKAQNLGGGHL